MTFQHTRRWMHFVDPSIPNPHGPNDADIIIYGFLPSLALSILALVVFSLALLGHGWRVLHHRTWSFIPAVLCCMLEILGYIFRTLSTTKDPYRINYYILNYFFITVAPVFLSASIYVMLTMFIRWTTTSATSAMVGHIDVSRTKGTKRRQILWIFVTGDILTTIIQITGASLVGKATSSHEDISVATTDNYVLLAGLAVQLAFNLSFLLCLSYFVRQAIATNNGAMRKSFLPRVRIFLVSLFVATLMVCTRTAFRVAEAAQGVLGSAETHEVFFGVFEFAPIVVAVFLLAVWHPGAIDGSRTVFQEDIPGKSEAGSTIV